MPNLVEVTYCQTGQSTHTDALRMREMQAGAYAARDAQHLLIKAPPVSGKSRALMFLPLGKMDQQGVSQTIGAVPERSIGTSFADTRLSDYGFFTDREFDPKWNLCTPGGEQGKLRLFQEFLKSDARVLICTHLTAHVIAMTDSYYRGDSVPVRLPENEAVLLWPKIKQFAKATNRQTELTAVDSLEKPLAEALIYIRHQRRQNGL